MARLSRRFAYPFRYLCRAPYNPRRGRNRPGLGSCAFARHYLRNHCYFLFLRVMRCFSSPGSPPAPRRDAGIASGGLPHSEIRGSMGICPLPRLFAAYHVLRRLREPRHPSCALVSFPLFLYNDAVTPCDMTAILRSLRFYSYLFLSSTMRLRSHGRGFQYVNVLFPVIVVPGRVELPTSTLSV